MDQLGINLLSNDCQALELLKIFPTLKHGKECVSGNK